MPCSVNSGVCIEVVQVRRFLLYESDRILYNVAVFYGIFTLSEDILLLITGVY